MTERLPERVYPTERVVVDIMDAAHPATEQEVMECLRYLYEERGLKPGRRNGPRTSFPKKGAHSVGVARQYCGRFGKQENYQVAVSLSVATATASLPVAWRLYLPEEWANDPPRLAEVHVPPQVQFQTKPQMALEQILQAVADGVVPGVVLADEVYGSSREFPDGVNCSWTIRWR